MPQIDTAEGSLIRSILCQRLKRLPHAIALYILPCGLAICTAHAFFLLRAATEGFVCKPLLIAVGSTSPERPKRGTDNGGSAVIVAQVFHSRCWRHLTPLESSESVAFMFLFVAAQGNSDERLPYFYAVVCFYVHGFRRVYPHGNGVYAAPTIVFC